VIELFVDNMCFYKMFTLGYYIHIKSIQFNKVQSEYRRCIQFMVNISDIGLTSFKAS